MFTSLVCYPTGWDIASKAVAIKHMFKRPLQRHMTVLGVYRLVNRSHALQGLALVRTRAATNSITELVRFHFSFFTISHLR